MRRGDLSLTGLRGSFETSPGLVADGALCSCAEPRGFPRPWGSVVGGADDQYRKNVEIE